jgi:outer membrane protein assembly factor BamB
MRPFSGLAVVIGIGLAGITVWSALAWGQSRPSPETAWRQWGGPNRNFIVNTTGLADAWPEGGPRVIWSRALGTGHSSILAEDGRLYSMYRKGNARSRQGPWDAAETVVVMDAATGTTIWEHTYPSPLGADFSYGAGPHSTPLLVGDRLFTIGTNKELFAFDKKTGKVLWSHDLIKAFGAPSLLIRPVVKAGYGCSPIAYGGTIICSVGGPGQSVMAFRQDDGRVAWKSGDFLTSAAAPLLIRVGAEEQLVVFGGGTVNGLDPRTGAILWSHPHDPGNDLNMNTPLWGPDNILLVSAAYKTGSRALRLRAAGETTTEEIWYSNRVRFMFLSMIGLGDHVYGTSGDLGPSFLTAINIRTGEMAWQHRGIGRASLVYADGKAILLEEDGDLTLAKLTPEGVTVLSQQPKLFDTMSWTAPTLVGTTLYARDREKIVALDVGKAGGEAAPGVPTGPVVMLSGAVSPPDGRRSADGGRGVDGGRVFRPGISFSGTWKLDPARSTIGSAAVPVGLMKSGAAQTLHITHAANGTVIVESQINESQSRSYKPGGRTTTPVVPTGTITMTSRMEGGKLVSEGALDAGAAPVPVKETFAIDAEGRLTLSITVGTGDAASSVLVYARTQTVEPCKAWPTPCK